LRIRSDISFPVRRPTMQPAATASILTIVPFNIITHPVTKYGKGSYHSGTVERMES
jgi:hypothetical protein